MCYSCSQCYEDWRRKNGAHECSFECAQATTHNLMVTRCGRVFTPSGAERKLHKSNGYLIASGKLDGKHINPYVHRLVAFAFLGEQPTEQHTVDHIDGNRMHNCVGNLRWASRDEQASNKRSRKKTLHSLARTFVFSPLEGGECTVLKGLDEVLRFLGEKRGCMSLYKAIKNGTPYCGGTWKYADKLYLDDTWRPIPPEFVNGNFGYFVSKRGEVTTRRGRITLGSLNAFSGYYTFGICGREYKVHRLVASAWLTQDSERKIVNHKNGIKSDNRVENLEWVTHSENTRHAVKTGLLKKPKGRAVIGTNVRSGVKTRYESMADAGRAVGGSGPQNIYGCIKGNMPTAYGHTWRYAE